MIKKAGLLLISYFLIAIIQHAFSQTPYFTSTEYKKALWMTTRFYGGQRSGDNNWLLYNHLPSGVDASLTGKAFIGDNDAGYDLSGGWHDCGDHVKFGQTEFYSAYMLLKGYDEFPTGYGDYYAYNYQGYKTSGNWSFEGSGHAPNGIPDILDEVKHATDYFIKCAKNSTTFYYQVGQGNPDHAQWVTAVKMQTLDADKGGQPRVAYKNPNDASMPSFCGATLALMSRLYRKYDAAYADLCLVHAKYAYDYAKAHPGVAATGDGGFYTANDNWKDDYSTMCAELFWTTTTEAYRTEALSFTIASADGQGKDIYGKNYGFDYTNNGDIAIYNQALLGNASAKTILNTIVNNYYLTKVQADGQFNDGNTGWGPLRYNANTAFIVALWQKLYGTAGTPHKYIYDNIDYILGKNSSSQSFVVGFGTKSPKHPHHRNVYLSDANTPVNSLSIPVKNQQFGLMVGGTRSPGSFNDNLESYTHTEGGIDYNACLVGVLAYINSVLSPVTPVVTHSTPKLGTDQSLCGKTSILLNANVAVDNIKTYTWKKGTAVVQAASKTGNTYTVTAAGTYTCIVDSLGIWSTQDEIIITATMPAVSLGSTKQLCNPATVTLDMGVSGTGYTYQWKKNNVVVPGETSKTLLVHKAGTYAGTVSATGCSSSGSVVITSALPTAGNDTLCSAGTANLTITGSGGPYQWYTAATGGTLLTTGTTYKPAVSAAITTYYVQDGGSVSVTAGPAYTGNTLAGPQNAGAIGIKFTASKAFTITQVTVLPFVYSCNSNNVSVTFDLFQGTTKIGTYTSSAVACTGAQTAAPFSKYTLGFTTPISVPAAGNYTLTPSGGNQLVWFDSGANFSTMDASGVMDITDDTRDDKTTSFPGIFDIKIAAGSACARTPVYAVVNSTYPTCRSMTTDINTSAQSKGYNIYPNPSAETFKLISPAAIDVTIMNALGQQVERFSNITEVTFGQHLQPGMYYVVMSQDGINVETMNVIKY